MLLMKSCKCKDYTPCYWCIDTHNLNILTMLCMHDIVDVRGIRRMMRECEHDVVHCASGAPKNCRRNTTPKFSDDLKMNMFVILPKVYSAQLIHENQMGARSRGARWVSRPK